MTHPSSNWPSVLVPLPVRFTFDPAGAMYFSIREMPGGMGVDTHLRRYVTTARGLFEPYLPVLNTAEDLGDRTPEVFTTLPEWAEVSEDVQRWVR